MTEPAGYIIRRANGAVYAGTIDRKAVWGFNRAALFATMADAKKRAAGLQALEPDVDAGEFKVETA